MDEDNGILSHVAGEFVSQAIGMLPPASTAEDRPYDVVIDADYAGTVRLFARRQYTKRGRNGHWYWCVYRAEAVKT